MADTKLAVAAPQGEVEPITPMRMLQLAVEQGADLDKLSKLMDLQERWETNQAAKAFQRAKAEFAANPPAVIKTMAANFGGGKAAYKFAELGELTPILGPALAEFGLSFGWSYDQTDDKITVACTLSHVDGGNTSVKLSGNADTSGSKNDIQAIGSTITYLERYTLLGVLGLSAKGQDDDGQTKVEKINAEQKQELTGLLQKLPHEATGRFLRAAGVSSLDELPFVRFQAAKTSLEKKVAEASS
jgi:hypothetical protein